MTTFLATAQGHTPGEEWTFGVHFVGSPASLGDAVTSWHTAVNLLWTTVGTATTLQGYTSVVVGIDDVAVAELDDGTGRQVSKEMTALSLVGTALGETLPPQVSGCVSTRTALATKAGRGRFYLWPFSVDAVNNGRLDSDVVATMAEAAQAMLQSMDGDGLQPVVFHRNLVTTTNITRIDVGNVFDTQRRRRNQLVEVRTSLTI